MFIPDDAYFEKLSKLRPLMEDYGKQLISCFELFLNEPVNFRLEAVMDLRKESISVSASNVYSYVDYIHIIADIVINELAVGLPLFTTGATTYNEAINKYHFTVFMLRRPAFLSGSTTIDLINEASEYIISEQISPIALSYILTHEPCGDVITNFNYWHSILQNAGLVREALLLIRLKDQYIGE